MKYQESHGDNTLNSWLSSIIHTIITVALPEAALPAETVSSHCVCAVLLSTCFTETGRQGRPSQPTPQL